MSNEITIKNLLIAIFFLVFGIILLTSNADLLEIVSNLLGMIIIVIGIIKSIIYIYMKGKYSDYSSKDLVLGLFLISFGLVLLLISSALSITIRLFFGMWILFVGINRMVLAIDIKEVDRTGFIAYLSSAIVMIIVGVLLVTNLFDNIIGLFIIIYAVTELVNYVYSNTKNNVHSTKSKTNKKIEKTKKNKVVEAIIEE